MKRPKASLLVRDLPVYRQEVFAAGLVAVGFEVVKRPPDIIRPGDALIIWNRYGVADIVARRFEAAGAAVFVTENGYIDIPDAKKTFALALNRHNGLGRFPLDKSRSAALPEPAAWRSIADGDVLLLPQRGIGVPGVAMPRSWATDAAARLRGAGFRGRIRTRAHPGTERKVKPLARDLEGVAFAVTWGSSAGLKALVAGCPVIHELPGWIGRHGASEGVSSWSAPRRGDRRVMLELVASAQWSDLEIVTGEPFARLLEFANAR